MKGCGSSWTIRRGQLTTALSWKVCSLDGPTTCPLERFAGTSSVMYVRKNCAATDL